MIGAGGLSLVKLGGVQEPRLRNVFTGSLVHFIIKLSGVINVIFFVLYGL